LRSDLAGGLPFDNIIFQFPHPGGVRPTMAVNGRALLDGFSANAAQRLASGGRVVLTVKSQYYVAHWRPVEAARAAGLDLVSVTEFHQGHYPGYYHVTTGAGARAPDVSRGITFVFKRS
jgi:hypothetical protein